VTVKRKLKKIYLALFGKKDYQKAVILCRSRTGSNFLISLLNKQTGVQFTGEIFRRLKGRNSQDIWNTLFGKKRAKVKVVGFKLFYDHPFDSDDRTVWNNIDGESNIKIIHLRRKNIVRSIVSKKIAESTDEWVYSEGNKKKAISLDANAVLTEFKHTQKGETEARKKYELGSYLEIIYEDLCSNQDTVMQEVCTFLGMPYSARPSELKQQNSESLDTLITNFDEIKATFAGSEIESLLDQ